MRRPAPRCAKRLRRPREPPRGFSDPKSTVPEKAGFFEAFKEFGQKPTFWTLSLGAAFVAFVGYGLISFQAPFLMRVHGVSVAEAAMNYGAPLAAVAAFGTFAAVSEHVVTGSHESPYRCGSRHMSPVAVTR